MEKDQDRALARLLIKHASAAVGHLGHIAPPSHLGYHIISLLSAQAGNPRRHLQRRVCMVQ